MYNEFLQMLQDEKKMNYISKQTHIDRRDLYVEYLDCRDKTYEYNSDGIKIIYVADSYIFMYTKAIDINPIDAELYFKRASYYEILHKQNEAIADYSEAIKLNPDYTDAYLKRSLCYKKMGLKNESINDYNNAIRLDPAYGDRAVLYGFITKQIAVDVF